MKTYVNKYQVEIKTTSFSQYALYVSNIKRIYALFWSCNLHKYLL